MVIVLEGVTKEVVLGTIPEMPKGMGKVKVKIKQKEKGKMVNPKEKVRAIEERKEHLKAEIRVKKEKVHNREVPLRQGNLIALLANIS